MEWLDKAGGLLRSVRAPLSLAGLTVLLCYWLFGRILDMKIFAGLDARGTIDILNTIMAYAFWLAIVALGLGLIGFIVRPADGANDHGEK